MDFKTLLRDRRAQLGLGVAGVAGVYVLAKRRGAGSPSGTASSLDGASSVGGIGGYNSTASDVAQQLSDYKTGTQQVLDDFASQLNTTLSRLSSPATPAPSDAGLAGTSPTIVSTPVTAAPAPTPTTVQTPALVQTGTTNGVQTGTINRGTIGSQVAKYVTVVAGQNWNTISKSSGDSLATLRQLNGGTLNGLKAGDRVRIG